MHQVIVQHFELDGIPQAMPRATKHSVHELAPQLTEGGFDTLSIVASYGTNKSVGLYSTATIWSVGRTETH